MKKISIIFYVLPILFGCDKEDETKIITGFTLLSEAVSDGKLLDSFKCEKKTDGKESSIPLKWVNVPDNTGSLAIVMFHYPNPDDHVSDPNTYLFLWNISPTVTEISHGTADDGPWYMGPNKDHTAISYTSPCSSGSGTHHYVIKLYALNETPASFPDESTMDMSWQLFQSGVGSVTILGTATLEFDSVTP